MARIDRDDAGVSVVTTAMLFPGVLFLILLVVEAGLYFHAAQRASAAADRAVEAARSVDATEEDGEAAGDAFLAGAPLLGSDVDVTFSSDDEVVATVTGTAHQLVPGIALEVTAVASAPRERFVPEPERGP
jgi:Flp pilus assembly protein TadG